MKRILVATDGSIGGARAVEYAAQLAKDYGTDLLIVKSLVVMAFQKKCSWLSPTLGKPG